MRTSPLPSLERAFEAKKITMGYYINDNSSGTPLPTFGKVKALIVDGAFQTDGLQHEPNLICVAERSTHDAAIYCYDLAEYNRVCFGNQDGEDNVTWLVHPKAAELAHYP